MTACVSAHAEVVRPSAKVPAVAKSGPAAASQVEPTLKVVISGGSAQQVRNGRVMS